MSIRARDGANGTTGANGAKPTLQSVGIALSVLDVLADAPELTLSELARRVGVAKSTAHRTCSVLTEAGLLTRTPSNTYQLGLRLIEYGRIASERSAGGEHALPLLIELRTRLGETVQLAVPSGGDAVYVERVEGAQALRYSGNGARRAPVHRSSSGKILAAFVPGVLEERLAAGLPPSTGYTIVVPDLLRAEIDKVREQGFARSVDETEIGASSLAVPVRSGADGNVVAALSVVGPSSRLAAASERGQLAALRATALQLSEALGVGSYELPARRRG